MTRTARIASAESATDTTLVTTAETVVATLAGISTSLVGQRVKLRGWVQLTLGAATTTVTLRVRRTSVTGTLVGEANPVAIPSAAATTGEFEICVEDSPGEIAGGTYVLTAEQASATGNGTALQSSLEAMLA